MSEYRDQPELGALADSPEAAQLLRNRQELSRLLSSPESRQLLAMLDEIRTRFDLSILLSTHDFATLEQYADKVVLLRQSVLKVGTPREVLASPEFQSVFHLTFGKGAE